MKTIFATLSILSLLLTGCVSRTVSSDPSLSDLQNGSGFNSDDKIITKDFVWIWQSDFWNP